ncbi:hypothetical protein, partial [Mesorhizobium sp. M5C.F.Ca.IN.020.32.2.1]
KQAGEAGFFRLRSDGAPAAKNPFPVSREATNKKKLAAANSVAALEICAADQTTSEEQAVGRGQLCLPGLPEALDS